MNTAPTDVEARQPGRAAAGPPGSPGGWWASTAAGRIALLSALLAVTAWNVTRSAALGEAEGADRRGDDVTALQRALDHLDRRPWSRRAARVAALCLSRLDFAVLAEPYYRRAGALDLDDLHVRAFGLVRGNHRLRAEATYQAILRRWPDDPTALRRLGAELITMMRWDEARAVADRLARTPAGEVDGLAMIGAIEHHRRRRSAAIAAYRRVLEVDPGLRRLPADPAFRRVFWAQLTEDLLATGRASEARMMLEAAPSSDRGPALQWLLGRACFQDGALDEAGRRWEAATLGDPGLADAWVDLGRLALVRGRPGEAIAPLERAAALAPGSLAAAHHLAQAHRRLGQVDRAERYQAIADRIRRGPSPGEAPEDMPPLQPPAATASPGP
ncbi:tetratricopeptide repeat protein [Tautonia plasticadhaerens]|uniref:Tetratricopeptide repeat protein n=1 Tax=Tautonia plasticadhaerens TaxID=2527974 RepID=A0A518HEV2_9BACT|nr:tetratricopeptide repeat protein [Tautonia plasticadhaerens]QDV39362.1 Tetratricopeptide repeat protein [Tautonia plasticadhaerens]